MAIDLCNKLVDNDLTREELLENIEVRFTSCNDVPQIIEILARGFGMRGNGEAFYQIINSKMELDQSVKVIDKRDGKIYGLLMFAHYPITMGSPINYENPKLARYLSQYYSMNGHSFILDERLRGTGIDKEMLNFNKELFNDDDFIWCAVEKDLKSHKYWERLGFIKIFSIPEASFYILPLNKDIEWDLRYYLPDYQPLMEKRKKYTIQTIYNKWENCDENYSN
jgi:hypothetical protein